MKIEFTTGAYTSDEFNLSRLMDGLTNGDQSEAGEALSFSLIDMSKRWVKVGKAHITVEILDARAIQNEQLATLKSLLDKERAESQKRQNAILNAISRLQALEWEGAEA